MASKADTSSARFNLRLFSGPHTQHISHLHVALLHPSTIQRCQNPRLSCFSHVRIEASRSSNNNAHEEPSIICEIVPSLVVPEDEVHVHEWVVRSLSSRCDEFDDVLVDLISCGDGSSVPPTAHTVFVAIEQSSVAAVSSDNTSKTDTLKHISNVIHATQRKALFSIMRNESAAFGAGSNHQPSHSSSSSSSYGFDSKWLCDVLKRRLRWKKVGNNSIFAVPILGEICYFRINCVATGSSRHNSSTQLFKVDDATEIVFSSSSSSAADDEEDGGTAAANKNSSSSNNSKNNTINATSDFIARFGRQVGGLSKQAQTLMENIDIAFASQYRTIAVPKCTLIWGVEGVGKTLFANMIMNECRRKGINVVELSGPSLLSRIEEASEEADKTSSSSSSDQQASSAESGSLSLVQQIFMEMNLFASSVPSLIVMDEFEVIAASTSTNKDISTAVDQTTTKATMSLLHNMLDYINRCLKVALIAITRDVEEIDASFRVAGRFEHELYIPIPGMSQREEILRIHLKKLKISLSIDNGGGGVVGINSSTIDEDEEKLLQEGDALGFYSKHLSKLTAGFVGRDLERLTRIAYLHAVSRAGNGTNSSSGGGGGGVIVAWPDFQHALRIVKPSQTFDFGVSIPSVSWDQVGGYEKVKKTCEETLYWPLRYGETYKRLGLSTCSGMLLYGPSGCGKSMIVKALASMGGMNFIAVKGPELFSKYTGETEEIIRNIFKRARQHSPCVLVFDEVDAIAPRRDTDTGACDSGSSMRALSQLLNEMDGIQSRSQVFLVGCSNRPDLIDQAILRPGRLEKLIYVGPPTQHDRLEILKVITKHMPLHPSVSLELIAERTELFSAAGLVALCRESAIKALREDLRSEAIHMRHFEAILSSSEDAFASNNYNNKVFVFGNEGGSGGNGARAGVMTRIAPETLKIYDTFHHNREL